MSLNNTLAIIPIAEKSECVSKLLDCYDYTYKYFKLINRLYVIEKPTRRILDNIKERYGLSSFVQSALFKDFGIDEKFKIASSPKVIVVVNDSHIKCGTFISYLIKKHKAESYLLMEKNTVLLPNLCSIMEKAKYEHAWGIAMMEGKEITRNSFFNQDWGLVNFFVYTDMQKNVVGKYFSEIENPKNCGLLLINKKFLEKYEFDINNYDVDYLNTYLLETVYNKWNNDRRKLYVKFPYEIHRIGE